MFFKRKQNKTVEKVSFNEIESDNQQNPDKINNENYGTRFDFLDREGNIDEYLEIVNGDRLTAGIVEECIEKIDRIYYTINLEIKDYIKNLVLSHPELCFIAKNKMTGEVVGYLYMFALTSKCTVDFLLGNVSFESLKEEHFLPEGYTGLFNLNIAEFAVVPEWQNSRTYRTLFSEAVKALAKKAESGCYVNFEYIEISNVFERQLAQALGLSILSGSKIEKDRKIAGSVFNYETFRNLANYHLLATAYTTIDATNALSNVKDYSKMLED